MKNVGWEVRPAGWLALFILATLLAYFIVRRLRRPSDKNQPNK